MTTIPERKVSMHCKRCGSTHLGKDAFASWDVTDQVWVLQSTYDSTTCLDCDNEGDDIIEERVIA